MSKYEIRIPSSAPGGGGRRKKGEKTKYIRNEENE